MPFKKSFRKRPYRKRRTAKKQSLNKAVKKVVFKAKPKREERFYLDKDFSTSVLANSFQNHTISNVAQGDQFNQRSGKRIYVSGVRATLAIQNNSTVKAKFLRLMLLRGKDARGTTLDLTTWTNLYRDENFVDTTARADGVDVTYPLNTGLVQVLFDHVYKIPIESEGTMYINRFIPIKRYLTYDSLGTGNIPTTGQYHLIAHICDGDDVTTATVVKARGMYRLHFKDA